MSEPTSTDSRPRLRVAPSPTGDPHVGTAYMSMFDLAYARQQGGSFVLRIEDTDRARYQEGSEQQIYDTLRWLGLQWDEGPDIGGPHAPYRQSERLDTYQPYVQALLDAGHAYHCWCSSERLAQMRAEQQAAKLPTGYDRLCYGKTEQERSELDGFSPTPVVRMLIPDDFDTTFTDLIRGPVSAPRPDDQVILKADGFPTYHLAVVVDDHEMGITHVVRGEEWISSTPKHVLLYRWLGLPEPHFAHMPLLRDEKKAKISKRKSPWARLTWFKEQGYLPEALLNFLALLGYPPIIDAGPDGEQLEREVFSFAEFTERFDWAKVNTVGPIFNLEKLNWLNGHYIRELEAGDLAARLLPFVQRAGILPATPGTIDLAKLRSITELVQTRIVTLVDALPLIAPFYTVDADLVIEDDARAQLKDTAGQVLQATIAALEPIDGAPGAGLDGPVAWRAETLEAALRQALVEDLGIKPRFAFGPVRTAVSGARISPPLFESMEILGKTSVLARLRRLLAELDG